MVCAIIAVATAVTLPFMVRSIQGNRLRNAARTVVKAGRYARSMAILKQRRMALSLDLAAGRVTVLDLDASPAGTTAGENGTEEAWTVEGADDRSVQAEPVRARTSGRVEVARALDQVRFVYVEKTTTRDRRSEGVVTLVFDANGRCEPYEVELIDANGRTARITVDLLAVAEVVFE